jgi:hypothetical protein
MLAAAVSDVAAALNLLRQEFRTLCAVKRPRTISTKIDNVLQMVVPVPVCLGTQLSDLLAADGGWRSELQEMQLSGEIRLCKAPLTGVDQTAVVFTSDLTALLANMRAERASTLADTSLDVYAVVLERCNASASCRRSDVEAALHAAAARRSAGSLSSSAAATGARPDADAIIGFLLREGFLLRHLGETAAESAADGTAAACAAGSTGFAASPAGESSGEAFGFGVPRSGALWGYVLAGRAEVAQRVRQRRNREMPRAEAEGLRLSRSPLPTRFHVRDAIGAGLLVKFEVSAGGAGGGRKVFLRAPEAR